MGRVSWTGTAAAANAQPGVVVAVVAPSWWDSQPDSNPSDRYCITWAVGAAAMTSWLSRSTSFRFEWTSNQNEKRPLLLQT